MLWRSHLMLWRSQLLGVPMAAAPGYGQVVLGTKKVARGPQFPAPHPSPNGDSIYWAFPFAYLAMAWRRRQAMAKWRWRRRKWPWIRRVVSFFCPSTPPAVFPLGVSTLELALTRLNAKLPTGAAVRSETEEYNGYPWI